MLITFQRLKYKLQHCLYTYVSLGRSNALLKTHYVHLYCVCC